MKSWLLLLFIIVLGGAGYFALHRKPISAASPSAPIATSVETEKFRTSEPLKRVMELYQTESERVGKADPDPKATQIRLQGLAANLNAEEVQWLVKQALDPKIEMDARFFAVYLVGLNPHPSSVEALSQVAASPLPESKKAKEWKADRYLRMNAIEGMCTQAHCKLSETRDHLLDVQTALQDEPLRDFVNRCLYACQYGKPIAQREKEIFRKARLEATK